MPLFRRKPGRNVLAHQFNGDDVLGVCRCPVLVDGQTVDRDGRGRPHVHTIHKDQLVFLEVGDWVLPEPDGEHYYPVKPDIFADVYEAVAEQEPVMMGTKS